MKIRQLLNRLTLLFCASSACCIVAAATEAASGPNSLIYVADYEDGTMGDLTTSGNAPTVTSDVSRIGSYAMRSYLDRNNSPVSYRTEASVPGEQNNGQEYWVGISMYLPDGYAVSDTWEILFQVHRTPEDWSNHLHSNPVFALWVNGDKWQITGVYNPVFDGGTENGQTGAFSKVIGTHQAGQWTDFVFNWKWAYDFGQGGFTKVWMNDNLVLDYTGPNTYNNTTGPYLKYGIYKGWTDDATADSVSIREVFHDEFRVAGSDGSYELVAPGGLISRPLPPVQLSVQ